MKCSCSNTFWLNFKLSLYPNVSPDFQRVGYSNLDIDLILFCSFLFGCWFHICGELFLMWGIFCTCVDSWSWFVQGSYRGPSGDRVWGRGGGASNFFHLSILVSLSKLSVITKWPLSRIPLYCNLFLKINRLSKDFRFWTVSLVVSRLQPEISLIITGVYHNVTMMWHSCKCQYVHYVFINHLFPVNSPDLKTAWVDSSELEHIKLTWDLKI